MPKKAKQKDKKKSKVKKIPAKAGAKARVSKDGKVEVILPVDRSRGPYKKRKTEEQKIQERLEQLRTQERRQFSRDVLAPERLSSGYRSGGSIYRSDVRAPEGGFTGIVSSKQEKENERLKNVEKKLDKLIDKKPESEPAPAPAPAPKKESTELETVQSEIVRANIRRGMERRDREQRQKLAEERARREEEKARREQSRVRVATRKLREEKTAQEQSRRAEEERQQRIEAEKKEERSRQISTRDRRLDEREREKRLRESQRELELISQREKAETHKRREQARKNERNQLIDDIIGGESEKLVTLKAEPNPERERRALEQRRKALQDEQDKKDREEAFKEREKIKREEKQLREQEKQQARKEAQDIFSEIERAPKTDVEIEVKELEPEVEDTDEEFQDVQESEPDQDIARELLRDEVNNRERKLKQEQQRANELDKLNREFIAHKNREDRNRRRREERRKRQELAKDVVGKAIQKAETQEQARELLDETIQKAVEKKESRDISKSILSDVIDESVTKSHLEKPPVTVGRGRDVDIDKLLQTGATREQINDYQDDLRRLKRLEDGVYSAFGINLSGTAGGLDYKKISKAKRLQIRIDSVKKLRERGLLANEIQQFTRTLDEINDLIDRRNKFGRDFQRRGGAVQLRPAGGTGRAGRPRGQRVPEQVEQIEREDPQPRD